MAFGSGAGHLPTWTTDLGEQHRTGPVRLHKDAAADNKQVGNISATWNIDYRGNVEIMLILP
eukprot:8164663-Pyramimonas_sp.AAC.1